jgi:hypothetical protein
MRFAGGVSGSLAGGTMRVRNRLTRRTCACLTVARIISWRASQGLGLWRWVRDSASSNESCRFRPQRSLGFPSSTQRARRNCECGHVPTAILATSLVIELIAAVSSASQMRADERGCFGCRAPLSGGHADRSETWTEAYTVGCLVGELSSGNCPKIANRSSRAYRTRVSPRRFANGRGGQNSS